MSGSRFSSPRWNTGNDAFGGNGVPGGSCVKTGLFGQGVWSLPASAGGRCLTRNFFGTPPDAIAVHDLISSNSNPADFFNFEVALGQEFHDEVSFYTTGSIVDKIWWDWQKLSPAHKFNTYFVGKLSACRPRRTDPKPFLT